MDTKYLVGIIVLIIVVIGAAVLLGGGSGSGEGGKIDIVGSTSVQPIAEALAEKYQKENPNVKINVQGGGSSVGIKSTQDGTADIGTSSKKVEGKDAEGLKIHELGQDGIVIAVNKDNKVEDLTKDQLRDIFSGKITNWKEVGGEDGKINVVTREAGSGTLDAFEKIVMDKEKIISSAVVQSSTEAVKQSVAKDPNAIGFVSYASMSDDVKSLKINGVAISDDTIADGSYELQRPFLFLTKGDPSGEVKKFIDWALGEEGSKILAEEKIIKSKK